MTTESVPAGILPIEVVLATAAKITCSGIFLSGRELAEIRRNAIPHACVIHHVDPSLVDLLRIEVDRSRHRVSVAADIDPAAGRRLLERRHDQSPRAEVSGDELDALITRARTAQVAQWVPGQGGIILPSDGRLRFRPREVRPASVGPGDGEWPAGDSVSAPASSRLHERIERAIDGAFVDEEAATAAVVVVHEGRLVAERYRAGIAPTTRLESWSMGKSIVATLIARLIHQGQLTLDQPAPVPAWAGAGDPRATITIRDLLQMSSGLRFSGDSDPARTWRNGTSDHFYLYGAALDSYAFCAQAPAEFAPGSVGRYRNCDPLLLLEVAKHIVTERLDEDFLSWPQRVLFDEIGIRDHVLETDLHGNFLMTGFVYGTARDWARLGLLYLRSGSWNGRQLLPPDWSEFVATPAPAWPRPEYGGLFRTNVAGAYDLPATAYYMAGYGEQRVFVVPSADLVIVRMGLRGDSAEAFDSTNQLVRAVARATST